MIGRFVLSSSKVVGDLCEFATFSPIVESLKKKKIVLTARTQLAMRKKKEAAAGECRGRRPAL